MSQFLNFLIAIAEAFRRTHLKDVDSGVSISYW